MKYDPELLPEEKEKALEMICKWDRELRQDPEDDLARFLKLTLNIMYHNACQHEAGTYRQPTHIKENVHDHVN